MNNTAIVSRVSCVSRDIHTIRDRRSKLSRLVSPPFRGRDGETSESLLEVGYADKLVVLTEGKVIARQKNHGHMSAEVWKKIPEWLEASVGSVRLGQRQEVAGGCCARACQGSDGPGHRGAQGRRAGCSLVAERLRQGWRPATAECVGSQWPDAACRQKEMAPAISQSGGVQFPKHSDISTGHSLIYRK